MHRRVVGQLLDELTFEKLFVGYGPDLEAVPK